MTDMARLEAAADKLEIMDLIYRYCRSMDRMDHEQGYAIWHEDGTAEQRQEGLGGHTSGHEGPRLVSHRDRSFGGRPRSAARPAMGARLPRTDQRAGNIFVTLDRRPGLG